jgi:hypothetical protein
VMGSVLARYVKSFAGREFGFVLDMDSHNPNTVGWIY